MERLAIARIGECLLVTIQVDLHDQLALKLREEIGERILEQKTRGVLLDISGLDTLDTFIARVLAGIGSTARLLGAVTVLVGMRPAVAMTLVELGLRLDGLHTALDLERGLALIASQES